MGWKVRESNPVGDESFRARTDPPWGPPSLLYNRYRRPGRGVNRPPLSSAEVEERVEAYLCFLSGPSWPVPGRTLHLLLLLLLLLGLSSSSSLGATALREPWPPVLFASTGLYPELSFSISRRSS